MYGTSLAIVTILVPAQPVAYILRNETSHFCISYYQVKHADYIFLMRSFTTTAFTLATTALVLGALFPTALAHGDVGGDMDMDMGESMDMSADQPLPDDQYPPTYFSHSEHRGVLLTHIGLMVLGWVVVLPLGELNAWRRSQYSKHDSRRCS